MLESENLLLRALEPEDIDQLYKWENDESLWELSGTTAPYSKYVLKQFIETAHMDIYTNKQLRLVIVTKENNKSIGCLDLFEFDPLHRRCGIGILIADATDRRKGFASEALKLTIQYCFETLDLHQVFANIGEDNKASHALFNKAGFVVAGTKKDWNLSGRKWHAEIMLQLINP